MYLFYKTFARKKNGLRSKRTLHCIVGKKRTRKYFLLHILNLWFCLKSMTPSSRRAFFNVLSIRQCTQKIAPFFHLGRLGKRLH
ncbi:hypothetical protein COB11_05360 [Candidatus Aerophobetes bacterium]|uniref:Uncharacterized protein n=1 Tax=Aerophobetes bacterium TaxID=2030807 RepID=A0A2A4YFM5_UNCAE|nr:MAG: hypothetical protein COB11_05360 [Candidatus Aerophobetes bacterium]